MTCVKDVYKRQDVSGALDKLSEELEELKTAVAEGTNVEEELGDLLFLSLIHISACWAAIP